MLKLIKTGRSFMPESLRCVVLLAGRELRDQRRDWRIMLPLVILVFAFPFLMQQVAANAVAFFARYGTTLIADRLVPFSILIIGFFPITISLVVALESFVGEKERGTIEPLLNTPIENWQLYCGKLLAGTVTPLLASFLSIGLYMAMISRQTLAMPATGTLALLFALTSAHAILMVSAALVISVQSTSIRAANLLASFIIIPVALLMQGESVLLFWGSAGVLWLAIAAVLVMAGLLVRLGLAHFRREYLIGREVDVLSIPWIWATFWRSFGGGSPYPRKWYAAQVMGSIRRLAIPLIVVLTIALGVFWTSFRWTTENIPRFFASATPTEMAELVGQARDSAGLAALNPEISASRILGNNLRATTLILLGGLVSFSVLGVTAYILNIGLLGGVLAVFGVMGYSPLLLFVAGILPHGAFELPALMLASAAVLRLGAVLVSPQTGKSMGQVGLEQLADTAKVFVGAVAPLLVTAAFVEAYITPWILRGVLR